MNVSSWHAALIAIRQQHATNRPLVANQIKLPATVGKGREADILSG